jgi:Uma2 family endonuclease
MTRKIWKYFQSGAAEVWVVYPASKSIEIHQPVGGIRTLGGDELITSAVLPGFELPVSEIFRF